MPHRTQAYLSNKFLFQALNATQGSIPIQQDNNPGSKCHTGTQAYLSNKILIQALNATQGHKRSYPTRYQFSALNATQGHKPSDQQAINIDPK